MIPKDEATKGAALPPEDSAAINDLLKKACVKMFEGAVEHNFSLPWHVEVIDTDGDVFCRMVFGPDSAGEGLAPIRDDTPPSAKGSYFHFPVTATLTANSGEKLRMTMQQPKPDLPTPELVN